MATYNNTSSSSTGIGFTGVLAVAFIILKLIGVIAWPWIWVLSPLWIGALCWVAFFVFIIFVVVSV